VVEHLKPKTVKEKNKELEEELEEEEGRSEVKKDKRKEGCWVLPPFHST
jgi:hypothetical protein